MSPPCWNSPSGLPVALECNPNCLPWLTNKPFFTWPGPSASPKSIPNTLCLAHQCSSHTGLLSVPRANRASSFLGVCPRVLLSANNIISKKCTQLSTSSHSDLSLHRPSWARPPLRLLFYLYLNHFWFSLPTGMSTSSFNHWNFLNT